MFIPTGLHTVECGRTPATRPGPAAAPPPRNLRI